MSSLLNTCSAQLGLILYQPDSVVWKANPLKSSRGPFSWIKSQSGQSHKG